MTAVIPTISGDYIPFAEAEAVLILKKGAEFRRVGRACSHFADVRL
jgi:hypothetical protein